MKIRSLVEQGELVRPEDYDYDDELGGDLEEKVNAALPKMQGVEKFWADVDEARGEIEVIVELDGVVTIAMMQAITQAISKVVPVQFLGVSGGSGPFAVYLNFGITK